MILQKCVFHYSNTLLIYCSVAILLYVSIIILLWYSISLLLYDPIGREGERQRKSMIIELETCRLIG